MPEPLRSDHPLAKAAEAALAKRGHVPVPIRERRVEGPKARRFLRGCQTCGVGFSDVSHLTERGIWQECGWFCSKECAGDEVVRRIGGLDDL